MSDAISKAIEALTTCLYVIQREHGSNYLGTCAEAQSAIDSLQALQSREPVVDAKPIAAVTGYYNGDCVVKALDPALVLPAGMALYAAPPAGKGGE